METFIHSGLVSLNTRFAEIDLILQESSAHEETNQLLYKTLCRSAQVLLSAHFEGYLKDLVKNSLEDINNYSTFKATNFHLKKRFCDYFLKNSNDKPTKESHQKVLELISIFESLETKFKKEYFSYNDNQNPKASVLDKIAEQYGIKGFFKLLKRSNLDDVFSNTNKENIDLCESIKDYLLESTKEYPYKVEASFLNIDEKKTNHDNLWDAFLSQLLKRRHDIAHGSEIDNSVSHTVIEADTVKIKILLYAFTTFVCINCNPDLIDLQPLTEEPNFV